ncbi:SRPBCC family protein [Mesobaculum littorinae]|uniref:SRPBCC family protein n=1 Tax=Mesobaculum littorinae TaxID=2486419 RepID=A0A438AFH8_9RHOB|nr:SRPBCC family protein [Mesobaculum littorinae]RVV97456.1 SRPBCC family protein [Mesobaculum littorinae]
MKFSTRQDIAAPQQSVFEAVTDVDSFERQVMRRGVDLERVSGPGAPGMGLAWTARVPFRGTTRKVEAKVTAFDAPEKFALRGVSEGIDIDFTVELMALSRTHTRMFVASELKPLTFSARLMVQSLKLAKGSLNRRFAKRVEDYAATIEDRYRRGRPA